MTPQPRLTGSFETPFQSTLSGKERKTRGLFWDNQKLKHEAVRAPTPVPETSGAVFPEPDQLYPLMFVKTKLHLLQRVVARPSPPSTQLNHMSSELLSC